ncbi:MAG: putative metal-binding protein (TIGR02443 family) [Cellvibrionaceae bacterium]|jgi:uncharacterized metal-binding protein (TIGR02443 family)
MTEKVKKRFIAGAICPRCSAMDKLMMYKENEKDKRECVSCGFKDEMHFKQQARELETRVNTSKEIKQAETQVLTLDPSENKGKH